MNHRLYFQACEIVDYRQWIRKYDYFRIYDEAEDSCSCSKFHKKGICKHFVVSRVHLGKLSIPDEFDESIIKSNKGQAGRPRKVTGALKFN
jgi:hypothetical protein